jgi:hypothetical protein
LAPRGQSAPGRTEGRRARWMAGSVGASGARSSEARGGENHGIHPATASRIVRTGG